MSPHTPKASLLLLVACLQSTTGNATTKITSDALFDLSLLELQSIDISSTASLFSESVNETPSPITVITAAMIERSGLKSIKDVLIRYVPGVHYVQDSGEQVIAMRGVYASSQQKILFLLNGVRLNQRVLSAQDPDYSLSLNKLERIEVVRGPSSSIYGNSALTGVVNLITKSGRSHQGLNTTVSTGSYGLKKINLEYGKAFQGGEIYAWAQHFQTDGEKIELSAADNWSVNSGENGHFYIDRFRDVPARDIGAQIKLNNWTLLLSDGAAKYSKPFSSFGEFEGQTYDYGDYNKIDGIQPGGTEMYHRHLSLKYTGKLSTYDWITNVYMDRAGIIGTGVSDPNDQTASGYKVMEFKFDDEDYGLISYAGNEYNINGFDGNLIIGMQYEMVRANIGRITGYNQVGQSNVFFSDTVDNPMLLPGKEKQYALFMQSKQRLSEEWVINGGIRYDKKHRRDDTSTIENISSRLALSYQVNSKWNLKGVYAESFVDAPYFYRYNTLSTYQGSENLEPELLSSTQFTAIFSDDKIGLTSSTNIFYNDLNNFIVFRPELSESTGQSVFNSGEMITWGIENETSYQADSWGLTFNATYLELVSYKNILIINDKIRDVPSFWFNIILDKEITDKISSNLHLTHIGSQQSPIGSGAFLNGVNVEDTNNTVDAKTIANINFQFKKLIINRVDVGLNISNIFDTKHYQGGTVQHPYLQPGRWWSVSASYRY